MPKLSHIQRFSLSGRRYWSKFQNDRVIFWCLILHFAFHRSEHNITEILSNLIVYSLKCTKNRHRFSYMKTLAHYLKYLVFQLHKECTQVCTVSFCFFSPATQLARQVHQECTQVVCSNKVAQKRLTPNQDTPAIMMDLGVRMLF